MASTLAHSASTADLQDAEELDTSSASFYEDLDFLPLDILRQRAEILGLEGWEKADRNELLAGLQAYCDEVIAPKRRTRGA